MQKWIMRIIKSKTLLFSILLAATGAIQASIELFNSILTPVVYGIVTMAVGVIVGILRVVTTQPLKDK